MTSAGDVPAADRDATARDGAARLADAGDPAFELRPEPDRGGVVSNGAASPTQQWTTVRDAVAAVINALLEGLGVGSVGTAGART